MGAEARSQKGVKVRERKEDRECRIKVAKNW